MRILIALRSVDQAEGGPVTAAAGLGKALQDLGHEVEMSAHDDGRESVAPALIDAFTVHIFPRTRLHWEHSRAYATWLKHHVADYDLVIINSMWISHVHYAARACQRTGTPYVIRPHGCLTRNDMAHHLYRKRLYWLLQDRRNAQKAAFVHTTSEQEAQDARRLGLKNVEVIPLGVDSNLLQRGHGTRARNTVLFLGRIAEKKGLDIIVQALASPRLAQLDVSVDVLGVDHRGLQQGLQQLASDLDVADRVRFHGHAGSEKRAKFLRESGLLALPSLDENFGLAVAEAMASSMPVVISPFVSHAAVVSSRAAGIVAGRNVAEFTDAIATIVELPEDDYAEMGRMAYDVVSTLYNWSSVARTFIETVNRTISST